MNIERNFIEFRAGNKKEIRQSLANYCQVLIEEINESNLKEIYEKYSSDPEGISDSLWKKFHGNTPRIKPLKLRAYHYHKTGSNGTKEWFQKGLLNKSLGIKEFIGNLYKFYEFDLSKFEFQLSLNNDNHHDEYWANDGPEYGPYSFLSRKSATQSGQYNLPEVIERVLPSKITGPLRNKLKPTLVEFWFDYFADYALDSYIRAYCGVLLGEDFRYSPFEPNAVIAYENIVDVKPIKVKKSLCTTTQKKLKPNVSVSFTMIAK